jgi:hypothetical protein
VLAPTGPDEQELNGQQIVVGNLSSCRHVESKGGQFISADDFSGPGAYVLPLSRDGNQYRITPTPPSPGFPSDGPPRPGPPRFYPATAAVLAVCRQFLR